MSDGEAHICTESLGRLAVGHRTHRPGGRGASPRVVLASVASVTTACVLPSFLLGAMAVQMRGDLAFNEFGIGLAFSTFFAASSLVSAPFGKLAERAGPVRSLRIAAAVTAVTCLATAVFTRSLPTLLIPMAVAGAANALGQPAANLLIARSLPRQRQGFAFAVKQSAIPASTLLAGAAVPALALTVGWRWAYVCAAVLAVVTGALVPSRAAMPPSASQVSGSVLDGTAQLDPGDRDVPFRIMARLAVGISLGASAGTMLGSFLVTAAVESGMSESSAGLVVVAGSVAGIVVRLSAGVLADRREGRHLVVVAQMLGTGAITFVVLSTGLPAAYIIAGPLAFCTAWAWPGLFILAIVRANPLHPAAATGITQTGTSLGAVTGPLLFGAVASAWTTQIAWLGAGALLLGACFSVLSGRKALLLWRAGPVVPT